MTDGLACSESMGLRISGSFGFILQKHLYLVTEQRVHEPKLPKSVMGVFFCHLPLHSSAQQKQEPVEKNEVVQKNGLFKMNLCI